MQHESARRPPFHALVAGFCAGGIAYLGAAAGPSATRSAPPAAEGLGLADAEGGYASTHVIVRLRPGASAERSAAGRWSFVRRAKADPSTQASEQILSGARTKGVAHVFSGLADVALAAQLGLDRTYQVDVPGGSDTPALARSLRALSSLVEFAELDGIGGLATVPNDPELPNQYAILNTGQSIAGVPGIPGADIDATPAFDVIAAQQIDTSSITIGLLDAGIGQHVELSGRILAGYNIPDQNTITADECQSHGTHVSGIMAATGNNGVGMAGIAWQARIKPYVVVNGCTGLESWVAQGITMATDAGVRLLNMSLQYTTGSMTLHDAVVYAASHDVIMVAATGNQGTSVVSYPAKWPETIAVAATNNLDQRWVSSNYGPEVDIAAPGVSVRSLIGTTSYGDKSGTSMATPHVTGVIALMLAKNPTLTPDEVRTIIEATADDIDAPGFDNNTGYGRVNMLAALNATPSPLPADLNNDGVVNSVDLGILLGAWGACASCDGDCVGDLDGDCVVGPADLGILLGSWS